MCDREEREILRLDAEAEKLYEENMELSEAYREAVKDAQNLEAELERLREAVKPFAEVIDLKGWLSKYPDNVLLFVGLVDDNEMLDFDTELVLGDLRRAKAAVNMTDKYEEEE